MKRWMGILALVLLLSGCATPSPAPTETTTTPPTTAAPTKPTAPAPEMSLWYQHLDRAYQRVIPMGDDLFLVGDGILSRYTSGGVTATAAIPELDPAGGSLRIAEDRVVYFDPAGSTLVTLCRELKETGREVLQETVTGDPWISADGKYLYYCTPAGIRIFEAETGISRSLKVHQGDWQGITGSIFDGAYLICLLGQEDGSVRTLMVSTENGETAYEGKELENIAASGSFYSCITDDEWIFGKVDAQPQNLFVENAIPLVTQQMAYTIQREEDGLWLNLYDLNTGRHIAMDYVPEAASISGLVPWHGYLVFLSGSQLYFWDYELSPKFHPIEDETVYTAYRYTAGDPDTEGLAALQARAEALGKQYGIQILLWKDAADAEPAGYRFQVEHRTQIIGAGLDTLEKALARFPEGFFKTAASWTEDGTIRIVLVRELTIPAEECGSQYLLGWNAYIPLALDQDLEQKFYHGLGHVIDTQVLSHSAAFYEWYAVNPSGFKYDNDFASWQDRKSKYLEGSNRFFVNSFAMTFPVEDRAGMFEYAMMEGNEDIFASKYMQAKLKRLKNGMLTAFSLNKGSYPWEEYLK